MIKINFPYSRKLTIHDITDGHAYIVANAANGVEPTRVFICNKYHPPLSVKLVAGTLFLVIFVFWPVALLVRALNK